MYSQDKLRLIATYLFVCLPIRSIPVYFVSINKYTNLAMLFCILCGILLLLNFLLNKSKRGCFGGNIWWKCLRLYHSISYMISAYLIWNNHRNIALYVLSVDLVMSIFEFSKNRL